MKRTPYFSIAIAGIAMALLLLAPFGFSKTNAASRRPLSNNATNAATTDDGVYWYFVASYSDSDKRVTTTFYASGAAVKVYYKVRIAMDGFQGDLKGMSFATREEAEQDRATNWPNAHLVPVADPLN